MKQLSLALFSGWLMGLATAPFSLWWGAWVAIAPIWVLLVQQPAKSTRIRPPVWTITLAWGLGYYGFALSWITGIHPMTWMGVPWGSSLAIAAFCWGFLTLWGTALVIAWGVGLQFCCAWMRSHLVERKGEGLGRASLRILLGVTLWCVLETLWSWGPLWWSPIAYTQSPHNLTILQWGQLSGPTTVTAFIVLINGLIAEAYLCWQSQRRSRSLLLVALFLWIGLHGAGWAWMNRPLTQNPDAAIKVGIIQGNIPNEIKLYGNGQLEALKRYTKGYWELAQQRVDAVLLPETALPFDWEMLARSHRSFPQAIAQAQIPVWVGAFGQKDGGFTNSLFMVTGTGETSDRYDKAKLVPLGEYIPLQRWLGQWIDRLSPLEAHLVAGQPGQRFNTPFGRAMVGICYESAFAEHFRQQAAQGGQFILTASNNAHYSDVMPAQHHALDVMRAIETDRWAARATNTGYSAIVDPRGRTRWISPINTLVVQSGTIYAQQSLTRYVRWGNWLTITLIGASAIAWKVSS